MENKKTSLKITSWTGEEMTWEGPWDSNVEDILNGLYGMMVGLTWQPETVVTEMYEWAKEKLPENQDE